MHAVWRAMIVPLFVVLAFVLSVASSSGVIGIVNAAIFCTVLHAVVTIYNPKSEGRRPGLIAMALHRRHWFWRVSIGVVVGVAALYIESYYLMSLLQPVFGWLQQWGIIPMMLVYYPPPFILAIATYAYLTHRYYKSRLSDGETHCRKCDYILKGLIEPRCPECGEPV